MSTLTSYNGIQVVTPDPTGSGGLAINNNFKALSTHFDAGIPLAGDDSSQGFSVGSRWFDTTTATEWICLNDTVGFAAWAPLGGGYWTETSGTLYPTTSSDRVLIGGATDDASTSLQVSNTAGGQAANFASSVNGQTVTIENDAYNAGIAFVSNGASGGFGILNGGSGYSYAQYGFGVTHWGGSSYDMFVDCGSSGTGNTFFGGATSDNGTNAKIQTSSISNAGIYYDSTGSAGTNGQYLANVGGTATQWVDPASDALWTETGGTLYPNNSSDRLLIGGAVDDAGYNLQVGGFGIDATGLDGHSDVNLLMYAATNNGGHNYALSSTGSGNGYVGGGWFTISDETLALSPFSISPLGNTIIGSATPPVDDGVHILQVTGSASLDSGNITTDGSGSITTLGHIEVEGGIPTSYYGQVNVTSDEQASFSFRNTSGQGYIFGHDEQNNGGHNFFIYNRDPVGGTDYLPLLSVGNRTILNPGTDDGVHILQVFGGTSLDSGSITTDGTGNANVAGIVTAANLILTPSSAPGSPVEGQIYYDATAHKLFCWDGTTWQPFW